MKHGDVTDSMSRSSDSYEAIWGQKTGLFGNTGNPLARTSEVSWGKGECVCCLVLSYSKERQTASHRWPDFPTVEDGVDPVASSASRGGKESRHLSPSLRFILDASSGRVGVMIGSARMPDPLKTAETARGSVLV